MKKMDSLQPLFFICDCSLKLCGFGTSDQGKPMEYYNIIHFEF